MTNKPVSKTAKSTSTSKTTKQTAAAQRKPAASTAKSKSSSASATNTKSSKVGNFAQRFGISIDKNKVTNFLVAFILCCWAIFAPVIIIVINCRVGAVFANQYASVTKVGYNAEYLGTVKRNIPQETSDEGLVESGDLPAYPTYGTTLALDTDQKNLLISEANYLCAKATYNVSGSYDYMDENGYLYMADGSPAYDNSGNARKLYKHTAADSMYYGSVSDEEPAIIKRVTLSPRGYDSYSVTGVYAPAGEVIKIQISEADMEATGGIIVHIGQALYNRKANNIWSAMNINRMPVILNSMAVNKTTATLKDGVYTAYVGSFLGGPIYIHNTKSTISVTISGGVRYSHFILGYTTKAEFNKNAASSAPYFDLEVREYGVLHSGAKIYAEPFDYDDLYKAAILWEKISLVSTQGSNQGIVFLYDPFVAAGAAVAFPTQMSVNCPASWMSNALNYDAFVKSGAWGVVHEYNHNFQGYGVGSGGEVTNNAMNLVEYSLFTKISSSRQIGNYGAEELSDWNTYTSATWALDQIVSQKWTNGTSGLALYATLLHNFGPDNFIQAKLVQRSTSAFGENYSGYLGAWTNVVHYNMSYYFNTLLDGKVSSDFISTYTNDDYPMFVPVSSVYQTGRSYTYDGRKKYIETMQPYKIPYGKDFVIDLTQYTTTNGVNSSTSGMYVSGSVVIPDGFSYRIKKITQPANGKITKISEGVYKFKPNESLKSGKIYVTLQITKDDNAFKVEDVDLVLEFEQTHEMTKYVLEKTVYSYTENFYDSTSKTFTTTAADIYAKNFAGYVSVSSCDNENPINPSTGNVVQDCNADVWYLDTLQSDSTNAGDGVAASNVKTQAIVLSGKLYANEAARYRVSLRGRMNVALFISKDGKNYKKAVDFTTTNASFVGFPTDYEDGYEDITMQANSWLYFKAVLIRYYGESRNAFMGVGWGKWTEEQGTVAVDEKGNTIYNEDGSPKIENYSPASVTVSYATAYRSSYVSLETDYTTDYFYTRKYTYDYSDITTYSVGQELIKEHCQFETGWSHPLENLVNGDDSNYMHSSYTPTESRPVTVEAKLDSAITANRLIFDGSHNSESKMLPKDFKIWVSFDGENWKLVCSVTGSTLSSDNWQVIAQFDKTYTFSYYRVVITGTHDRYIALRKIIFQKYVIELQSGEQISPDDSRLTFRGSWQTKSTYSTFGHVYVGAKKAVMETEFVGTRFAILSASGLGTKFKVEIDGKEVSSIELKTASAIGASFISEKLSSGKHKVKVTCTGTANIDSIVIW
jgi:hypothetical protein